MTVLAAGFDALVNERANRMTWPKGQMRYNLATLAELRVFKPLHYTLDLDGEQLTLRRDAGRGRQRPVASGAGCGSPRARCSTTGCSTWS